MKTSLVLPTYNQAPFLRRTLKSILPQNPPFEWECIVIDDGSTDDTADVVKSFIARRPEVFKLVSLPLKTEYVAPMRPTNAGFRAARGEIIILQSSDVAHDSDTVIEKLCEGLRPKRFRIAAVKSSIGEDNQPPSQWEPGTDRDPHRHGYHIHSRYARGPLFYLGAAWRSDIYKIGGYDERFVEAGYNDFWFADCLMHGAGCQVRFRDDILGHHQQHDHTCWDSAIGKNPSGLSSLELWTKLKAEGKFHTEDAPWPI